MWKFLIVILLLSACDDVADKPPKPWRVTAPDGKPAWVTQASPPWSYDEAGKTCPFGYKILSELHKFDNGYREDSMMFRCK